MDISTVVGHLLSGLACKIYAAGAAFWMVTEITMPALKPLGQVATALN